MQVNPGFKHYIQSLKFGLYVITHPLDGFWDLNREKRGSLAAANTFVFLVLLVNLLKLQHTSFLFLRVRWNDINIYIELAGVLLPLALAVVANVGLTTLFDGKGTMKDIYMGAAYSMVPYILFQFPMIVISNVFTADEGAFYHYFDTFAILWCSVLVISAVMMLHDYSLSKALLAIAATVVGMMVILFIMILFFSLVSDSFAYFYSLYSELMFRFY